MNKNTVCSYLDVSAQHALDLTNHLVHDLGLSTYEVDELLTFVKKAPNTEHDLFPKPSKTAVATCVKRGSLFFTAFGVGNWNKNLLRLMFNKFEDYVQQPTYKNKLEIFSDGNNDYATVLPEYYNKNCLCYGQKIKSINGKKIIPALRVKVYGNPDYKDIETNSNECFNSMLRERVSRLVRKTKCHAKEKYMLNNALFLFQFYWNFMHELHKNVTPAILEKQATKVWSWGNFLHAKLTFVNQDSAGRACT